MGVYSCLLRWHSLPAEGRARFSLRQCSGQVFRAAGPHTDASWGTSLPFSVKRIRTGQSNTRSSLFLLTELLMHVSTGPSRSVPGYACPFTEQTEHIQKRARLQPVGCYFMLTPDKWDSAR